ncbi:MAG: hypothetical protein NTW65_01885 [Deltaproteobacteria bacterium]|nr:hypothetical protein [Deltaproteobacteria bacterium]
MKRGIKGIVILLLVAAVVIIPLSAKAEMQKMTENEMEMVTGQMTIGDLLVGGATFMNNTLGALGVNTQKLSNTLQTLANPLLKSRLMKALQPTLDAVVNLEIPGTT